MAANVVPFRWLAPAGVSYRDLPLLITVAVGAGGAVGLTVGAGVGAGVGAAEAAEDMLDATDLLERADIVLAAGDTERLDDERLRLAAEYGLITLVRGRGRHGRSSALYDASWASLVKKSLK